MSISLSAQMSKASIVKNFDAEEKSLTATWKVKSGLAQMLKGGVIMGAFQF